MNASYYLRLQSKQQGMDKILNILAIIFQIEPILAQVDQFFAEHSEREGGNDDEELCVENLGKLIVTRQN